MFFFCNLDSNSVINCNCVAQNDIKKWETLVNGCHLCVKFCGDLVTTIATAISAVVTACSHKIHRIFIYHVRALNFSADADDHSQQYLIHYYASVSYEFMVFALKCVCFSFQNSIGRLSNADL